MTTEEASAAYMAGIKEKIALGQYREGNSEIENAFIAGANWAYDTPKWKDFATEKPRHGQRMLAFLKGGMLMPCCYRDDGSQDAILHIGDREVNFGPVEIVLWLPLPNNPNLTQEGAK